MFASIKGNLIGEQLRNAPKNGITDDMVDNAMNDGLNKKINSGNAIVTNDFEPSFYMIQALN
jgi:hypothetical protein